MKRSDISDIIEDNRRATVFSLSSRGLNQSEIAQKLGVDQSTVSRDLDHITIAARNRLESIVGNVALEFATYFDGMKQIKKELWEIAHYDNNNNNVNANGNGIPTPDP